MTRHASPQRHSRGTRWVVSVLATLGALAVTSSGPGASATTIDPSEPIVYEGSLTLTSVEGDTVPLTARLTVDCATDPCTALVIILSGDFVSSPTNDQSIAMVDGVARADLPLYGDLCALRFVGAGPVAIDVTGDTASVTRESAATAASCPDGSDATAAAATIAGTLARVSGSSCLIDGTCPTPSPTPTATPIVTAEPIDSDAQGTQEARAVDEAGFLSQLRTVRVVFTPTNLLWASSGALVLALVIAFPAVLLDSSSERVAARIEQRRVARAEQRGKTVTRPPLTLLGWPAAIGGLLIAAAASAIVDPDFGFDAVGLRTVLSIAAGFLVVIALGWAVVTLTMRRTHPASRPRIEFRVLTIAFVALAVVASLLSGFEPGVIFGFVAGVGFGAAISTRARAGSAVLMTGFMIVVSAAAWGVYSALVPVIGADPSLLELIILESLSGIAIAGVSALPLALLPLRGLSGQSIWAFSRFLWLALYALSVAGFLIVLVPLPDSWQLVELDLVAWSIGYAVYLGVAVIAWLIAARPWKREEAESAEPETQAAED